MQQPAAYPMPGDKLQNFALPDAAGTLRVFANEVRGAPAILFALSDLGDPQQEAALGQLAEVAAGEAGQDVELYVVAANEPARLAAVTARLRLAFPLFSDRQGAILPRLLAAEPLFAPANAPVAPRFCSYVLDPNQRVLAALRRQPPAQQVKAALEAVQAWRAGQTQPQALSQVAPVLILPNVLEPALCERLIGLWHEGGHQEGSVSDGRQNVYAPDTKKNLEHVIKEPELSQHISLTMAQRIGPELKKVFNFSSPFRFEVHIVLSYQDQRQDFFGLHRDNHRPDSPRMFACSTNLNDDYEGGTLHFPEYGPHGYRPPAGGSAVFSCNLLHEARPVTRGQRFAMTSFFCLANQPLDKYPAERRRQMQV
jgi:predicted 2-oxoglutarate/Fe(II)-dependent dioxygenase YbiX/peroxiredoxin